MLASFFRGGSASEPSGAWLGEMVVGGSEGDTAWIDGISDEDNISVDGIFSWEETPMASIPVLAPGAGMDGIFSWEETPMASIPFDSAYGVTYEVDHDRNPYIIFTAGIRLGTYQRHRPQLFLGRTLLCFRG